MTNRDEMAKAYVAPKVLHDSSHADAFKAGWDACAEELKIRQKNLVIEIQRQLDIRKSTIESLGPEHVVLNGKELLTIFKREGEK